MSPLVTIVCASIEAPLRRVLCSFFIEAAPLTFVGRINSRTRDKLWNELNDEFSQHEMTMIYSTTSNEQGFLTINNKQAEKYVMNTDGLTLSVRRYGKKESWQKILGKTLPNEYPLVHHLIDTCNVAGVLWDKVLSSSQKQVIVNGFSFSSAKDSSDKEHLVKQLVLFAAGMHDVGKAHPHWQKGTLRLNADDPSLYDEHSKKSLPMVETARDSLRKHNYNSAAYFSLPSGTVIQGRRARQALSKISQGHHGTFEQHNLDWDKRHEHELLPTEWLAAQHRIEEEILDHLGITPISFEDIKKVSNAAVLLVTGVVILADWIASRAGFIEGLNSTRSTAEHALIAEAQARKFIESNGLETVKWEEGLKWESMFPEFTHPNTLQKSLVNAMEEEGKLNSPGLLLINAPMGAGKTEASLYVASMLGNKLGTSGIWVNLPTQATSDAMFSRSVEVSGRVFNNPIHAVSLMHSNSAISAAVEDIRGRRLATEAVSTREHIDDGVASSDNNLFISEFLVEKKLGGMSAIAVSTIDQLINASTRLKHNALRWLAISGKTLILDEVHDFDEYTFELIKKTVEWCGELGVPVIAMSATLSGRAQRDLVKSYYLSGSSSMNRTEREELDESIKKSIPLAGIVSPSWSFFPHGESVGFEHSDYITAIPTAEYNIEITETETFVPKVVSLAEYHVKNDALVLITCHTVKQAVETFRSLEVELPSEDIRLLHSRMPQEQKAKIVDDLIVDTGKPDSGGDSYPRKPMVLVSTQIVQQSMDLDFDVLITPMAPLPEVFQRIGRVHRHEQGDRRALSYRESPVVHVLAHPDVVNHSSLENMKEFSESGRASMIPYSPWQILGSFDSLKELFGEIGKVNQWHAKDKMMTAFEIYEELRERTELESDTGKILVETYREDKNSVLVKQGKGEFATIAGPGEDSNVLYGTTEKFTPRSSKASPTRLIVESSVVVPVWKKGSGLYLDSQKRKAVPQFYSVSSAKEIGKKSINVPTSWAKKHLLPIKVEEEAYAPLQYVLAFDVEQLDSSLVFSETEGLIELFIERNRATWL